MNKYGFELGHKSRLSVAELQSVFHIEGEVIGSQIWIGEFKEELDPSVLKRLGGTIKIIKFFDEVTNLAEAEKVFFEYLINQEDVKVKFALNLFNFNKTFLRNHKNLLKNLKLRLKDVGRGARFFNKPDQNIKSVVIHDEKLDIKGTDLNIVKVGQRNLLGFTIAVQNFRSYSLRDYERPARDAKSGMLPPKLAQIMINLACEGEVYSQVYDPFCGSGTVLMEALLMGYMAMGSDISEKAIADSKANLEWLKKNYEITYSYELFLKDATKIDAVDIAILPSAVVSEVYLGPPQSKVPASREIVENFAEVEDIILGTLKALKGNVRQGGNIVLALPFYRDRDRNHFIDNLDGKIKKLGYEIEELFGAIKRGSLLYDRKDQIVGREIFKLKLVEK